MLACETGFCGNKVECEGRGGVPPVSLAEFTLAPKAGEKDFYDVSYVDGYNIPMTVEPVAGTYKKTTNTAYDCTKCGACSADVNQVAPDDLKQVVNGKTVAVYTACTKFHTDEYCCAGEHNVPEKCKPEQWPREELYSSLKKICPTGYWYAYDDLTSTFACVGGEGRTSPDYNVVFC